MCTPVTCSPGGSLLHPPCQYPQPILQFLLGTSNSSVLELHLMESSSMLPFMYGCFAQHNVLEMCSIFLCVSVHFLSPSSAPLCRCTIIGLSMHLLMDMWIVSTLGLNNNAGMMFTYRSLCRYVFHFSQVSRSGLARSYGKCVFNFKRKFWHVSKVAVQFYIPTNRLQSYFPFTSSRGCVLVSHCTLICVSLMTHEVRQLFMCLLAIGIDSCEVLIFFTELSCFSY